MARPEKVAVVDEIRDKITSSGAAVLTEYRGLTVPEIARLRAALREAGTTYKIYKNTLARRAVEAAELGELTHLLLGPTAWAFVDGDIVNAAKAIRDFARTNDSLVVKGGLLEGRIITAEQVAEIASMPTREQLLAQVAGVFQAPMAKAAGLFSALQRKTAYALKALIEKRVEGGEELPASDESSLREDSSEAETPASAGVEEGNEGEAAPAGGSEDDSGEAVAPTEAADDAEASAAAEAPAEASQPEDEESSGRDAEPE